MSLSIIFSYNALKLLSSLDASLSASQWSIFRCKQLNCMSFRNTFESKALQDSTHSNLLRTRRKTIENMLFYRFTSQVIKAIENLPR